MPGLVIPPGTLPGSPAAGTVAVDSGDGNKLKQHDGAAWRSFLDGSSGGNVGLINYIANPTFDVDATSWNVYADEAGSVVPVDGTGGSTDTTMTRTTSSPLRGAGSGLLSKVAADRRANGVSTDFTIAAADRNRSLTISGIVEVSSAYLAGDIGIFVYDITGAKLTPISGRNSIDASGAFSVQFSTNSSTSYRLCFHIVGTNAAAWTVKFDDISVSPAWTPGMPAMSDGQEYTPAIVGLGTVTNLTASWRRVGDRCQCYVTGNCGTPTATVIQVPLPDSLTIDSTQQSSRGVRGHGVRNVSTASNGLVVQALGGDSFVTIGMTSAGTNPLAPTNGNVIFSAGDKFSWVFDVPIEGWSGTTAVQQGSRYLWAQKFASSATRVTTTPSKPGEYRSYTRTGGTVTFADAAPTAPPSIADGVLLYGGEPWGTSDPANQPSRYEIYVGRNKAIQFQMYSAVGRTGKVSVDPILVGTVMYGSYFSYDPGTGLVHVEKALSTAATTSQYCGHYPGTQFDNIYFDILVADDPVPVALAPVVRVEATSDAGQTVSGTATLLAYEDEVVDTHGAWNTNLFTCPVRGRYLATASTYFATTGFTLYMYKNGVQYTVMFGNGNANACNGAVGVVDLEAGDTLSFRVDASGVSRGASANSNRLTITRIGDI